MYYREIPRNACVNESWRDSSMQISHIPRISISFSGLIYRDPLIFLDPRNWLCTWYYSRAAVTKVNFKIGVFGLALGRTSALICARQRAIVCLPAFIANGKRPFPRVLTATPHANSQRDARWDVYFGKNSDRLLLDFFSSGKKARSYIV